MHAGYEFHYRDGAVGVLAADQLIASELVLPGPGTPLTEVRALSGDGG
ncbi:hypothetical protein NSERUTF1_4590 [Nocardia seriolae]|nr:hypothetical protein NSERUTF1_4590 [Nocardia seriolae]